MLNRLTVSTLLQSVIVLMAIGVVAAISVSAWNSWGRVRSAGRISLIADASSGLFKAMHNMRTDRASTNRVLAGEPVIDAENEKYLQTIYDSEMPAMRSAAEVLASVDFNNKATLLPALNQLIEKLTAAHTEAWDMMRKPKAARRPDVAKDYMELTASLLETLDKVSAALAATVNHQDPVIDQLLAIKQTAWLLRNTAGEASIRWPRIRLAAARSPRRSRLSLHQIRRRYRDRLERAGTVGVGHAVAAGACQRHHRGEDRLFRSAISRAARSPDDAVLTAGEKPEMTANQWSPDHGRPACAAR